jgi:hypothetical protein
MPWADSWPLLDHLLLWPQWLYDRPRWTLQDCWTHHTCRCAQPWISLARWPAWVMEPEHENHPSQMGWHLLLENVLEGSTNSPWDASDHRWYCRGLCGHDHTLVGGGSELSVSTRCCHLDNGCHLSMLLLHFGLFSPDRLIDYQWKVPLEGCRPISTLWWSSSAQPLAEPEQQWESLQVPTAEWTL